ncbi:MAG: helix-turn-helix domain-containing protein [Rhodocyclaceae bacterium]|nr:helix-turn-helix domain-containing protein [Rhodocyclaceae bacterium]
MLNGLLSPEPAASAQAIGDCFSVQETITTDADEHASNLQHWQQEYHQLSGGNFRGVLNEAWFGNIQLFREQTNRVVHQNGKAWDGSRTLGIPVAIEGDGLFCGSRFTENSMITLGHGDIFDFRTPKSVDVLAVTADAKDLRDFGQQVWKMDIDERIGGPGIVSLAPAAVDSLKQFLLLAFDTIKTTPRILNYPQIRKGMEQEIYNNLFSVLCGTDELKVESSTCPARKTIVSRAKEYVLNNPEEPVMIADLCRVLGVSRRTLQYSFQSVLDVSPVTYLRSVRLINVRRFLKTAPGDAETYVADAAARWGFWHLSRFAADYKLLFGELPSQTLRGERKRRAS